MLSIERLQQAPALIIVGCRGDGGRSIEKIKSAIEEGGVSARLACLLELSKNLVIFARDSYGDCSFERLAKVNELQHRVLAQASSLLQRGPEAFPDGALAVFVLQFLEAELDPLSALRVLGQNL